MSQENVEVVSAAIEAYNRRDWEAALKDAAPHFTLDFSRAIGPTHGVYDLAQTRRVIDEVVGVWDSVRLEPHEFIEAGEHVVVPWTFHTMGRDGIEVQARTTWVFTIRDGANERICMYQERKEALEAVGLEE
jgi:ketosteroid isomerase-like protein